MTRHSGISHRPSAAGGRARDAGDLLLSRSGNELSKGPFRKLRTRMRLAKKGNGKTTETNQAACNETI